MFCPQCKTEYNPGAIQCADCGTALVEQLPTQGATYKCENCSDDIEKDNDFCPHCGILFTQEKFFCDTHPASVGKGVCVLCHKLVCDKCLHTVNARILCEEHQLVEISEGWALVFQSADFYEAQFVRGKLVNAGITVNPQNTMNAGFLMDGAMDSRFGRSILKYPVKLFVPQYEYLDAMEVMQDNNTTTITEGM